MCEPVTIAAIASTVGPALASAAPTIAATGLAAVSSVSAINSQNAAATKTRAHAVSSANDETASSTSQYIEQNRSLIQGGFDAILEGRANESAAYSSAIENGVQGASIKAILRSNKQSTARSSGRTTQEMASLKTQTGASYKHISAKAQGRINSVPTTSFGIGDLAKIAAPGIKSQME